jgi:hypothetical protein
LTIGSPIVSSGGAPGVEAARTRSPSDAATAPSGGASITGGDGIDGRAGDGGSGIPGIAGGVGRAGTNGAGVSPAGTTCDAVIVVAALVAVAIDWAMFDCVTSPSSPGLAIRIETAMLQLTQTDGIEGAAFHVQFQIQICGGVCVSVVDVVVVI